MTQARYIRLTEKPRIFRMLGLWRVEGLCNWQIVSGIGATVADAWDMYSRELLAKRRGSRLEDWLSSSIARMRGRA